MVSRTVSQCYLADTDLISTLGINGKPRDLSFNFGACSSFSCPSSDVSHIRLALKFRAFSGPDNLVDNSRQRAVGLTFSSISGGGTLRPIYSNTFSFTTDACGQFSTILDWVTGQFQTAPDTTWLDGNRQSCTATVTSFGSDITEAYGFGFTLSYISGGATMSWRPSTWPTCPTSPTPTRTPTPTTTSTPSPTPTPTPTPTPSQTPSPTKSPFFEQRTLGDPLPTPDGTYDRSFYGRVDVWLNQAVSGVWKSQTILPCTSVGMACADVCGATVGCVAADYIAGCTCRLYSALNGVIPVPGAFAFRITRFATGSGTSSSSSSPSATAYTLTASSTAVATVTAFRPSATQSKSATSSASATPSSMAGKYSLGGLDYPRAPSVPFGYRPGCPVILPPPTGAPPTRSSTGAGVAPRARTLSSSPPHRACFTPPIGTARWAALSLSQRAPPFRPPEGRSLSPRG